MSDTYTTVTSQSWVSRVGGSFKGILLGILLFLGSFGLLFWNEGRAVKTYKGLKQMQAETVIVDPPKLNSANEGKPVYITGLATTDETLSDDVFPVAFKGIKMKRTVEIYQWTETSKSEKRKKVGGGEETVTTYTYSKAWSSSAINSGNFAQPQGHENSGSLPFESREIRAATVTLGDFTLSDSLVSKIGGYRKLEISAMPADPQSVPPLTKVANGGYYIGYNPAQPAIGDVRVGFEAIPPTDVSFVSVQKGKSFAPFEAQGKTFELLSNGKKSVEDLFQGAHTQNKIVTWAIRVGGFFMMFIGLRMIFAPLSVVLDVLPILGNIASTGIGIICFLLALPLTLITIGIAWVFYRPLLAGILFGIAAVGLIALFMVRKGKKEEADQAPPSAPPSGAAPPPPPA